MDHVVAARAQMGTSLAFHIVFAALGIGLPVLLCAVEGLWLLTKKPAYQRLAHLWASATAVLFAVGAVSGTVLSFELGLLWPDFMRHAGGIIGIPFSAEGFAFFIEAIFIGLYLYGWERLSPFTHWLCTIPIAISGALSALFVVCANAWMNTPTGFRVVRGQVVDVDPWAAMFNPAWPTEVLHTLFASYVFTFFAVAAVYAAARLRSKTEEHILLALRLTMLLGALALPVQIVVGDLSARFDAHAEPIKLAALEGQFHTEHGAPLRIGGLPIVSEHRTIGAIEIPGLLSFLAFEDPHATVRGLDAFPAADEPDPVPVHLNFQVMVGLGTALLGLAGWWLYATRKLREPPRALLWVVVCGGPAALIAMESGWMVTELGRQPWIVHGFLRTRDAVTSAPGLDLTFYGFSVLYLILGLTTVWLLLRIARFGPSAHHHGSQAAKLHHGFPK